MNLILQLIGYPALTWVIISYLHLLPTIYNKIQRYVCMKCWAFYLTLICTFNPLLAASAAFIAYAMDRYINNDNDNKTIL